ncbi:hypothetical protein KTD31_17260 [Burkholderia multivorans]|uniref:hypothetical protein n=1 Tax=Burkholderia multivorans TaxID=87883 RepID=UPI000A486EF4|nr:hypothetical protein [Burkholderia multivorans]MBU9203107.1 hypothetical protein [Burkholderia multivorans]MCA8385346.1 hypothetical protein [Burkholderia multivorans]
MKRNSIRHGAIAVGAAIAAGSAAYAARDDAALVFGVIAVLAIVFGMLATAAHEGDA